MEQQEAAGIRLTLHLAIAIFEGGANYQGQVKGTWESVCAGAMYYELDGREQFSSMPAAVPAVPSINGVANQVPPKGQDHLLVLRKRTSNSGRIKQ